MVWEDNLQNFYIPVSQRKQWTRYMLGEIIYLITMWLGVNINYISGFGII